MARLRAPHRGPRDLGADRPHPGGGERGGELAAPAAEVEHPITGIDLPPEERHPSLEVGRRQLLGQALPEVLVILLQRAGRL